MVVFRRDLRVAKKLCSGPSLGALRRCSRAFSSSEEDECTHPVILDSKCVACSLSMDDEYGLAFDYVLPGLRYSHEQAFRLKKTNSKKVLRDGKLHLVLDLDHTLLHSRAIGKLTPEEKLLEKQADSSDCGDLFTIDSGRYLMKLRPYLRTFLEEASTMYEMWVCTMGSRGYVAEVARIIDPESKYFSSRIISREDLKQRESKNLNLVLGQESGIVILDDTESVWKEYRQNLILVERYDYFRNQYVDSESYAEKKIDESESDGTLTNMLRVLKTIHGSFFDECGCKDVRISVARTQRSILMECVILFSEDVCGDYPLIWDRAEEMGATCTTVIGSEVTHVVSSTVDCEWVKREDIVVVQPSWIDDAYYLWRRQSKEE